MAETDSSSAWSLVDETVLPSRGIEEEEMIHGTLKALGSCAATTSIIVQRLRGHTGAIILPAAGSSPPMT
jgi:hypothetical protein